MEELMDEPTHAFQPPQEADLSGVVCLYFGDGYGCLNCGGSTRSVGEDGIAGPFEGDPRYCSEDCFADAHEMAERERRWRETEWCPTCGFDRHEHAPDCERKPAHA